MAEDRKFPIAYIGEEFIYKTRNGRIIHDIEADIRDYQFGYIDVIHAEVLKISHNYFTGEYVYKLREDRFTGKVEEKWYDERRVREMKRMVDADG